MDLSTDYLGLELEHPLVVSACQPLSEDEHEVQKLENSGAAAVVLYSLFEEQIRGEEQALDHYQEFGADSFSEASDFFPDMGSYNAGPEEYLELIEECKRLCDIPIIASLNGASPGGWTGYAERMEEAGADALELNIYRLATDVEEDGEDVEEYYNSIVSRVETSIDIPFGVKLSPFFSSIPATCKRIHDQGADSLVLFNRFYQPDFNIEELEIEPTLKLSRSYDMRLPLRWISIMHGKIDADFALTSGVHNYRDVLKSMMAGASVSMMASELLENGPIRLRQIQEKIVSWMEDHEYDSIRQMQGSMSMKSLSHPDEVTRANYQRTLHEWRPDPTGIGHFLYS